MRLATVLVEFCCDAQPMVEDWVLRQCAKGDVKISRWSHKILRKQHKKKCIRRNLACTDWLGPDIRIFSRRYWAATRSTDGHVMKVSTILPTPHVGWPVHISFGHWSNVQSLLHSAGIYSQKVRYDNDRMALAATANDGLQIAFSRHCIWSL